MTKYLISFPGRAMDQHTVGDVLRRWWRLLAGRRRAELLGHRAAIEQQLSRPLEQEHGMVR